ncbi:MAG: 2-oxoacid:acceptor oxidoreductase family protein [Phycisphaerae bacterium]|nr:2-oxoacid:acceptor oxidoreductase family protein [Phycisphaerae bacterium]
MTEKVIGKAPGLYKEFVRKGGSAPTATHYCPGCGHGILHKIIGEAMSDFDIQDRTIAISPVGCAVFAYYYFDCGNVQAAHGRAPAVATGISRARPDSVVISYQGDGDLASIGLNETLQAANRGEKIAVIFVNNTVYGMTGGQMAPTTLVGEKTSTSPDGRDPRFSGYPIHMCELIDTLKAPVFIERVSLSDIAHIRKARKAIRKAIEIQSQGKGYAFVEVLSNCPTNLKQNAEQTIEWINEHMEKEFPLGNFRDTSNDVDKIEKIYSDFSVESLDEIFELEKAHIFDTKSGGNYAARRLKVAGFGGQGVLSMGLLAAGAGCFAGHEVSWFPSYGPEQRGGTANCSVVISDDPIGSPVVQYPDILVAMNRPSLEKFAADAVSGATIFYDSSAGQFDPPDGITAVSVPTIEIARKAGSEKAINTAMLGVMIQSGVLGIGKTHFCEALKVHFAAKQKVVDINLRAIDLGSEWARENL